MKRKERQLSGIEGEEEEEERERRTVLVGSTDIE